MKLKLLPLNRSVSLYITAAWFARLDVVITQASQECLQMFFWNSTVHKSISFLEHASDHGQTLFELLY